MTCGGSAKSDSKAKVHLFCRECALNDLMAQRQEIKRLEREAEMREREREDEKRRAEEENRRQDLERFERVEMGFEDVPSVGSSRKRRAEEMHASTSTSASRAGQNESASQKRIKATESESSFWIPGGDKPKSVTDAPTKATKLQPLCPGSTPESKHAYSLKGLIRVKFSESDDGSRVCPSCQKVLSNTSRPMLGTAEGCGHVVCGSCADLLASSSGQVACYVCEADLSPPGEHAANDEAGEKESLATDQKPKAKKGKDKDKKDKTKGRLIEISCEGTGFAGGGANMAKREGVAFQC